jgi:hypothetical protein
MALQSRAAVDLQPPHKLDQAEDLSGSVAAGATGNCLASPTQALMQEICIHFAHGGQNKCSL